MPPKIVPPAANLSVIHQNEPAEIRDAIVIIEHERRARLNRKPADFVALQLLALARAGTFACLSRVDESITSSIETTWHFTS